MCGDSPDNAISFIFVKYRRWKKKKTDEAVAPVSLYVCDVNTHARILPEVVTRTQKRNPNWF